jgi:hypothetical protein
MSPHPAACAAAAVTASSKSLLPAKTASLITDSFTVAIRKKPEKFRNGLSRLMAAILFSKEAVNRRDSVRGQVTHSFLFFN